MPRGAVKGAALSAAARACVAYSDVSWYVTPSKPHMTSIVYERLLTGFFAALIAVWHSGYVFPGSAHSSHRLPPNHAWQSQWWLSALHEPWPLQSSSWSQNTPRPGRVSPPAPPPARSGLHLLDWRCARIFSMHFWYEASSPETRAAVHTAHMFLKPPSAFPMQMPISTALHVVATPAMCPSASTSKLSSWQSQMATLGATLGAGASEQLSPLYPPLQLHAPSCVMSHCPWPLQSTPAQTLLSHWQASPRKPSSHLHVPSLSLHVPCSPHDTL